MNKRFKRMMWYWGFVALTVISLVSISILTKKEPEKIVSESDVSSIVNEKVEATVKPIEDVINKVEEEKKKQEEEKARLEKKKKTLYAKTAVNIRSEAKIGDNIKSVIYKGSEIPIYEEAINKDWYRLVDDSNGIKYVNKNYLITKEQYEKMLKEELTSKQKVRKQNKQINRGGSVPRSGRGQKIKVEVSHYCPCTICSDGYGRKTASGKTVQRGMIAAPNTKLFPFGTKVVIDGVTYTVEDRGGYIIQVGDTYRIDVYVPSHSEALKKGRYWTTAIVY